MHVNMMLIPQLMEKDNFTKGLYNPKEAKTVVNKKAVENGVIRIRTAANAPGSEKSEKEFVRDALNALLAEYVSVCGETMSKDELLTLSHVGIISREDACATVSVLYKGVCGLMAYLTAPFAQCVEIVVMGNEQ